MPIPQSDGFSHDELKIEDVLANDFAKEDALKLVVQDTERTESWLALQQYTLSWKEADTLYQSPRFLSAWEGTNVTRANVTRWTVAKHVNSICPSLTNSLFYDNPPFILRPRPGTKQSTTDAKTALFAYQLDDMSFRRSVDQGFISLVLFGTGIWKWGWLSSEKVSRTYRRKRAPESVDLPFAPDSKIDTEESDEFESVDVTRKVERPFFDHIDIRHVLVDPGCRVPDIREAKFVIHRQYMSLNDLESLRDNEGYDIPAKADLQDIFDARSGETPISPGQQETPSTAYVHHAQPRYDKHTVDPSAQGLEILEYWTADSVITVLQRKWVIRNEDNPFGVIPFYSANFWNIPDSFYGLGVGRIVGQDQRVEQGLTNAALDILALGVNPSYARSRGANVPVQQIRQRLGGIVDVDGDVRTAFALIETPKIPQEVWAAIQNAQASSESATGANDLLVQGGGGGRTSLTRTATGAGALSQAVTTRLQQPVESFISNVFEPFVTQLDELNNERLPISVLRAFISDELGDTAELDVDNFKNGRIKYEVLAGAHLSAKRQMAQALPLMIQLFENPAMLAQLNKLGNTADIGVLFRMLMEVSEWKNTEDVIRKMTAEEQQFYQQQQQQQGQQEVQAKAQLEDQKFDHEQQLVDQRNLASAAREVLRHSIQKIETPTAVTGEPGNTGGFGSEV